MISATMFSQSSDLIHRCLHVENDDHNECNSLEVLASVRVCEKIDKISKLPVQ